MLWQSALLCRAGLLWTAVMVSRLSLFLCQWPLWLFGVCFIIWMDAAGNLLRIVRNLCLLSCSFSPTPTLTCFHYAHVLSSR